ncbi:MAG: type II secretion system ATPase GspE [Desulfosoma sp.]|uniref:type II secretion system ATPase GspE n=1 Tax=Desulfosoma sp. TaxID=2603217 RepID=UPI004048EE92
MLEMLQTVIRKFRPESGPAAGSTPDPEGVKPVADLPDFAFMDEVDFPDTPPRYNPLPVAWLKRFKVLPVEETDDGVVVVMVDPMDLATQEVVRRAYGKPLKVYRSTAEAVAQFIYQWYEADTALQATEAEGEENPDLDAHLWDNPEHLRDMASEAPIVRLVNHLITRAVDVGASDIHIEPLKKLVKVRYRIDGVLHNQDDLPKKFQAAIASRIKLMARMNIAEMRLPQDGRIKFKLTKKEIDIRVSSLPTVFGESLVLRLLQKEDILLDLNALGFPKDLLSRFKQIIALPYGIVLVTGPTGSGKTTTLYAAINEINTPDRKIVTVEDPVEYQLDGVNQVQVQPKIGLTFAHCLRSFLRQDPDVMLVGEIRDLETAEIAIQAALTGHMVFSTLHTNDAAGAITRLEDMGVEPFMITSAVVAVLAQRLVRRVCSACWDEVRLGEEERRILSQEFVVPLERLPTSYRKGQGCDRCGGTGYRGRIGLFEFLPLDEPIQREILKGADRNAIVAKAVSLGMRTLRRDGLEKVAAGMTTFEEVIRVTR